MRSNDLEIEIPMYVVLSIISPGVSFFFFCFLLVLCRLKHFLGTLIRCYKVGKVCHLVD